MAVSALDGHPLYQRLKTLLQEAKTPGERTILAEALYLDCRIEQETKRRIQIGDILQTPEKTKPSRGR